MLKYFIIIFFFIIQNTNANNKENIINNLKNTKNLNFDFEQNINGKIENGNCIIEYPKKIWCEYSGSLNKILVSNGKSLVIKTITSYYRYPLKKTALNLILDNNFQCNRLKEKLQFLLFANNFFVYELDINYLIHLKFYNF